MSEERYTLEEAKRELAKEECATYGHSFEVASVYQSNDPVGVFCSVCGKSWSIAKKDTEASAT